MAAMISRLRAASISAQPCEPLIRGGYSEWRRLDAGRSRCIPSEYQGEKSRGAPGDRSSLQLDQLIHRVFALRVAASREVEVRVDNGKKGSSVVPPQLDLETRRDLSDDLRSPDCFAGVLTAHRNLESSSLSETSRERSVDFVGFFQELAVPLRLRGADVLVEVHETVRPECGPNRVQAGLEPLDVMKRLLKKRSVA